MEPVVFKMSGEPRGKGRPRADTRGDFVRFHTDAKTIAYERSVSAAARLAMAGRPPFRGGLSVSLRFRMPIPVSASKKAKAAMASGETPHTARPDTDNMAKAILDGMACDGHHRDKAERKKPIAFVNDAQICRLFTTKIYAEKPGVDVQIIPLGEPA